jgi:hypothetical protein
VPTTNHTDEILATIGDRYWWTHSNCFGHLQAERFVLDCDAVIVELRQLFSTETCIELMRRGHGESA